MAETFAGRDLGTTVTLSIDKLMELMWTSRISGSLESPYEEFNDWRFREIYKLLHREEESKSVHQLCLDGLLRVGE